MKTITDFIFPKEFRTEAEEYIAYKRSLGFKFSVDDQRKLLYMLNHIYIHNHNDVTHLTLFQSDGNRPRTLHSWYCHLTCHSFEQQGFIFFCNLLADLLTKKADFCQKIFEIYTKKITKTM